MAKAAKKKVAESITLTPATLSKNGVEKLDVRGCESWVKTAREIKKVIEDKDKEFQFMRTQILNVAKNKKREAELKGTLYKTLVVHSVEGEQPAEVLFKNAFSKLKPENEKVVRDYLGEEIFKELFERSTALVMKKNVDLDEMRKLLGENFSRFFETVETLNFAPEFQEKRASVRPKLNNEKNAQLDMWVDEYQSSPDLRLGSK